MQTLAVDAALIALLNKMKDGPNVVDVVPPMNFWSLTRCAGNARILVNVLKSSSSFLLLMLRHDLDATGSAVRQAMEQPPNPRADVLAPSLRIATPSNRNNEEVSCTNIVKLLS